MSNQDPIYIFFHLKKTAGLAIHAHMQNALGTDKAIVLGRKKSPWRYFQREKSDARHFRKKFPEAVYVGGHHIGITSAKMFPNREPRFITLLRDPVDRIISHYNYNIQTKAIRSDTTIETFYDTCQRNYIAMHLMTVFLGKGTFDTYSMSFQEQWRYINLTLSNFWYVADYKNLNEPMNRILEEQGLESAPIKKKNVSTHRGFVRDDLEQELEQRILSENVLDFELYEKWKDARFDTIQSPIELPESLQNGRPSVLSTIKIINNKNWLGHISRRAA